MTCLHPTVFWNPTLFGPSGKPWECPDCHERWASRPWQMTACIDMILKSCAVILGLYWFYNALFGG